MWYYLAYTRTPNTVFEKNLISGLLCRGKVIGGVRPVKEWNKPVQKGPEAKEQDKAGPGLTEKRLRVT